MWWKCLTWVPYDNSTIWHTSDLQNWGQLGKSWNTDSSSKDCPWSTSHPLSNVINTYLQKVSLQIQNYDSNKGLGDFVDPDSLISIEVTYVDRSVIDQSSADQSLIVSIQFNSLDIIANQETIIELIYFARRIMPDSLKAAAVAAAASSNQRRRKMPTKVVTE